ncbi:MAG: hypothetical protein LBI38_07495 [Oscillospiraceae bacterium]|nr:hypothetical protein [Oscillospiraceae bacterium]
MYVLSIAFVSRSSTVKNLAYIHAMCGYREIQFIEVDEPLDSENDLRAVLEQLAMQNRIVRREDKSKFSPLAAHFRSLDISRVTLTFDDIGKIIGEPLCVSARKYRDYWFRRGHDRISESWLANGYKINSLDIDKQKISFIRADDNAAIALPSYLQGRIPPNCKAELDNFFAFMKSKYGL